MRGRGLILVTLCLAALIINLDTTIVNVALPALVRETGATTTDLQWVVDAYNLAFGALILAAGSLADRLGRKGMLLAGLGVFGASSLAGAFATTTGQLIAARAVMGLGAAMMFPATLSLLTNVFTARRERALAIGVWGASAGVGIALGPIAGGWLLEQFWWGAIFVFMAPVAAVVAALVAWRVPTSRDPRTPPVDWRGFALSTAGMSLIVYGIIQAPGWGWASGTTIGVLGFIFLMTQYFQVVRGYSPLSAGVRLLPVAVTVGVAAVAGTRLAVRIGNKIVVGGGMLFFSAALLWIATFSRSTSYGIIAASMVVLGAGMGFTQAPATEAIMGAVPEQKAGIASAVNGSTRLFGGTLGVAVIGSVAASLYISRLTALLPPGLPDRVLTAARGSVGGAAITAQHLAEAGFTGAARALNDAAVLAFIHSLTGACLVAAAVAAIGALLALTLLPNRPRAQQAEALPASGIGAEPHSGRAGIHHAGSQATASGAATKDGETGARRP